MTSFWTVLLRSSPMKMHVISVMSLMELVKNWRKLETLLRSDSAMRLVTIRFPAGTHRQQVYAALALLAEDEKVRLYHLPQAISRVLSEWADQQDTACDRQQAADHEIAIAQLVTPDAIDHEANVKSREKDRHNAHDGILALPC